jgi:hypothetical protein
MWGKTLLPSPIVNVRWRTLLQASIAVWEKTLLQKHFAQKRGLWKIGGVNAPPKALCAKKGKRSSKSTLEKKERNAPPVGEDERKKKNAPPAGED